MLLFEELKRRNVLRVGVAYAVGAWVLLQVLDVLGEILELPPWGGRLLLALLIVGFFLALIFAWAFELTPEGVKRDAEVDHSQPLAAQTGRRLNRLIIVTLVLALALFAADKFLWDPARDRALLGQFDLAAIVEKDYRGWVWSPDLKAFRQSPEFKALARERGLLEFWREQGFPPFCQARGADDFECE